MSQEQGYVEAQGQITGGFTVPQGGSLKEKREDIQLLPMGPNSAVIYCMVDLGTHMESFGTAPESPKRKIMVGFEHPQLKQCFYVDDPNPRSTATWMEGTLAVNEKAKLRKIIEAVVSRKISDQEAYSYDISKLLGARVLVNIEHNVSKKDGKTYEKVAGITAHGQMPVPVPFNPENEYLLFNLDPLGNNFKTENFAKLPNFLKKKIIDSAEGRAYAAKGGLFAQMPKKDQIEKTGPSSPNQPMSNQPKSKLVMLVNDYSYEVYIQAGWTDDLLISNEKARVEISLPPSPSGLLSGPAMPQSPPSPNFGATNPQQNQSSSFEDEDDNDVPF